MSVPRETLVIVRSPAQVSSTHRTDYWSFMCLSYHLYVLSLPVTQASGAKRDRSKGHFCWRIALTASESLAYKQICTHACTCTHKHPGFINKNDHAPRLFRIPGNEHPILLVITSVVQCIIKIYI